MQLLIVLNRQKKLIILLKEAKEEGEIATNSDF